jgi:diguanylate cyclase (GGDEF)-like protein
MIRKDVIKPGSTVRAVMTANVAAVGYNTSLIKIAKLMAEKRISSVVVSHKEKIMGIISERDLVRKMAADCEGLCNLKAKDVMTAPVETLPAKTPIERAVTLMSEKGYRRFPIVDSRGRLAGMVTQSDVLKAFTRELEVAHEKMKDLAIRDCLTGMFNRRFFLATLEKEFYRSRRYGTHLALLMIDIDDFKKINDEHGHQYGDTVLKAVSEIIRRKSRTSDIAARFGGEEFVVLAPGANEKQAMALAERLRLALEETGTTASLGVAHYPNPEAKFPDDLVHQSDMAMYEAKNTGKNTVVQWDESMEDN